MVVYVSHTILLSDSMVSPYRFNLQDRAYLQVPTLRQSAHPMATFHQYHYPPR